jgi:hypothetical protein
MNGGRSSIEDALAVHTRLHEQFELARTHLAQGSIERRAKQKAAARAALQQAEVIFAALDASQWLEGRDAGSPSRGSRVHPIES